MITMTCRRHGLILLLAGALSLAASCATPRNGNECGGGLAEQEEANASSSVNTETARLIVVGKVLQTTYSLNPPGRYPLHIEEVVEILECLKGKCDKHAVLVYRDLEDVPPPFKPMIGKTVKCSSKEKYIYWFDGEIKEPMFLETGFPVEYSDKLYQAVKAGVEKQKSLCSDRLMTDQHPQRTAAGMPLNR